MARGLPALTGAQFIDLLVQCDGWSIRPKRRAQHGIALRKRIEGVTVTVIVPNKGGRSIPQGTLMGLLSGKQSRLGRRGLERLLEMRKKGLC